MSNATTCAPKTPLAVLRHAPGDAPGLGSEARPDRGRKSRRYRPVSSVRQRHVARARARSETSQRRCESTPAARRSRTSVSPIAEWPRPLRWPISCSAMVSTSKRSGLAAGRHGPGERGVEEDVGLEKLARRLVDQEAGRRQHAIERRLAQKAERRSPVVFARRAAGEAAELYAIDGRRARPAQVENARATAPSNSGSGHAGRAAVVDEVANRVCAHLSVTPAANHDAELQIRDRRLRQRQESGRDGDEAAIGARDRGRITGRLPPAPGRSLELGQRQSARGTRGRAASGPTIAVGSMAAASRRPPPSAPRATRKTPWLSPSTNGTIGPRAPRNTMTRWPTANPAHRRRCCGSGRATAGHAKLNGLAELAFQIASASSVTSVSMVRRSSVHRPSTATTRPRAIARASRDSSPRSAGMTMVADGAADTKCAAQRQQRASTACLPHEFENGLGGAAAGAGSTKPSHVARARRESGGARGSVSIDTASAATASGVNAS